MNKKKLLRLNVCKVVVEETSTFMINFFSYSHVLRYLSLIVTAEGAKSKRYVKLKYELPNVCRNINLSNDKEESTKLSKYFQRFKLKPNTYVFSLEFRVSKDSLTKEEIYFLMKVGSVSKCKIQELHSKPKQVRMCTIM